jgi:hypothetical protein
MLVMYKCIRCYKTHKDDSKAEKIFSSGNVLMNEVKIPLGICIKQQKESSTKPSLGLSFGFGH